MNINTCKHKRGFICLSDTRWLHLKKKSLSTEMLNTWVVSFWQGEAPTQWLTQTRLTQINSCQRETAATESAIPGKKTKTRAWFTTTSTIGWVNTSECSKDDELTTHVATDFYIHVTLISPFSSPGVLHNPVRYVAYDRKQPFNEPHGSSLLCFFFFLSA